MSPRPKVSIKVSSPRLFAFAWKEQNMEKIKGCTLYKKTLADGKSWLYYVQFTDRSGKRMTGKSVQKLRSELGDSETYKITRRAEADSICRRAIEAGFADGRRERANSCRLFSEYLLSFFYSLKSRRFPIRSIC